MLPPSRIRSIPSTSSVPALACDRLRPSACSSSASQTPSPAVVELMANSASVSGPTTTAGFPGNATLNLPPPTGVTSLAMADGSRLITSPMAATK